MNLPGVEFLDVPRVILEPMIGVSGRPAVGRHHRRHPGGDRGADSHGSAARRHHASVLGVQQTGGAFSSAR